MDTGNIFSMTPPSLVKIRDLGIDAEPLFDATTLRLPNPLVFGNFAMSGDLEWRRWWLTGNVTRTVEQPAVSLVRYPPDMLVDEDRSYLTLVGDQFVAEQTAPWEQDLPGQMARMRAMAQSAPQIDAPCLLLARFGEFTWGHWLAEILIKGAIAEHLYPGRFYYVVPACVTEPTAQRTYSTAVLESLAAYGITPDRLIRLIPGQVVNFTALYDIADVWVDGIHPSALSVLRDVRISSHAETFQPSRLAAIRRGKMARSVFNDRQIDNILASERFISLDLLKIPFADQVRLFRHAELVVASLGSDCISTLFSPAGLKIVTLSPYGWRDGYFVNLFQRLNFYHADVRGASTLIDNTECAAAPHIVAPDQMTAALAAVAQAGTADHDKLYIIVDGELTPRHVGETVLTIEFGRDGNARRFLHEGWSNQEARHIWSLGRHSTLIIPVGDLLAEDLWLELHAIGYATPYLPVRPLTISVNRIVVGTIEMPGYFRYYCKISAADFSDGQHIMLRFDHPVCPSPASMDGGNDTRQLGLGVMRIAFHKVL